jgi:hypothetical protein
MHSMLSIPRRVALRAAGLLLQPVARRHLVPDQVEDAAPVAVEPLVWARLAGYVA